MHTMDADITHLAHLARLSLMPDEAARFTADLDRILAHFAELQGVATDAVAATLSAAPATNIFRTDDERLGTHQGAGVDAFPEARDGLLRVPAVFE